MDRQRVLVFWKAPSANGPWSPIDRETIPQWLRDEEVWDRMIENQEAARSAAPEAPEFYRITVVDDKAVGAGLEVAPRRRFAYLHRGGCTCVAFYLSRRPNPGEHLRMGDALDFEGGLLDPETPLKCGTCGSRIGWDIESGNIVEVS